MTHIAQDSRSQVMIAVDPHKASWTAAAVDASLRTLTTIRVPVSGGGYRSLRRFAQKWADAGWAIEGATGLGAPLTTHLGDDGVDVVDVPRKAGCAGAGALDRRERSRNSSSARKLPH